jgi:hypothetical protein
MKPLFRSFAFWIVSALVLIVVVTLGILFSLRDEIAGAVSLAQCIKTARRTVAAGKEVLAVEVPHEELPVPNAYDDFERARQALVRWQLFEGAYEDDDLPAQRALLKENAKALALLRAGLAHVHRTPRAKELAKGYDFISRPGAPARLLAMQARVRAADGDLPGAADAALDAVRYGTQISYGRSMVEGLLGFSSQSRGREELWRILDHLDAETAQAAAKRMETLITAQIPLADLWQEEMWGCILFFQEQIINPSDKSQENRGARNLLQQEVHLYMQAMQARIDNARLPYARQRRLPKPKFSAAQWLIPDERFTNAAYAEHEAKAALLLVALALQAYQREHGHYPDKLEALTPTCLARVPDDPFADGGALRYRLQENGYLLYSIGPDGKDNGGKPVEKKRSKDAQERFAIDENSKGDIVAGVHR